MKEWKVKKAVKVKAKAKNSNSMMKTMNRNMQMMVNNLIDYFRDMNTFCLN